MLWESRSFTIKRGNWQFTEINLSCNCAPLLESATVWQVRTYSLQNRMRNELAGYQNRIAQQDQEISKLRRSEIFSQVIWEYFELNLFLSKRIAGCRESRRFGSNSRRSRCLARAGAQSIVHWTVKHHGRISWKQARLTQQELVKVTQHLEESRSDNHFAKLQNSRVRCDSTHVIDALIMSWIASIRIGRTSWSAGGKCPRDRDSNPRACTGPILSTAHHWQLLN